MREGTLISQWCNESGILRWSKKIVSKTLDRYRPSGPLSQVLAHNGRHVWTRKESRGPRENSCIFLSGPWKWSREHLMLSSTQSHPNLSVSESHPNLYFCWKVLYGVVTVDWACGCFSSCQPGTSTSCTPLKRMQTQQRPFCHQIRCIFLDKWQKQTCLPLFTCLELFLKREAPRPNLPGQASIPEAKIGSFLLWLAILKYWGSHFLPHHANRETRWNWRATFRTGWTRLCTITLKPASLQWHWFSSMTSSCRDSEPSSMGLAPRGVTKCFKQMTVNLQFTDLFQICSKLILHWLGANTCTEGTTKCSFHVRQQFKACPVTIQKLTDKTDKTWSSMQHNQTNNEDKPCTSHVWFIVTIYWKWYITT